jgi:hypothetical protein
VCQSFWKIRVQHPWHLAVRLQQVQLILKPEDTTRHAVLDPAGYRALRWSRATGSLCSYSSINVTVSLVGSRAKFNFLLPSAATESSLIVEVAETAGGILNSYPCYYLRVCAFTVSISFSTADMTSPKLMILHCCMKNICSKMIEVGEENNLSLNTQSFLVNQRVQLITPNNKIRIWFLLFPLSHR